MKENNERSVKYPDNREVRKLLLKGEMLEIAKLSGNSISYVRGVLNGSRNNPDIIAWAKRIIADRKRRLEQIINPQSNSSQGEAK